MLRMWHISDKPSMQNQYTHFRINVFFDIRATYKRIWNKML